jgi:hypothetical protein
MHNEEIRGLCSSPCMNFQVKEHEMGRAYRMNGGE